MVKDLRESIELIKLGSKGYVIKSNTGVPIALWGKMPDLQKQEIENMSIFLASWMHLMVLIDNSSFFVIKHCTFDV